MIVRFLCVGTGVFPSISPLCVIQETGIKPSSNSDTDDGSDMEHDGDDDDDADDDDDDDKEDEKGEDDSEKLVSNSDNFCPNTSAFLIRRGWKDYHKMPGKI